MKKEILILGIIFLFIGVGIQPAFAVEITNDTVSDNIEDCACQVVDDYDIVRVKSLLNRAERSINRVEMRTKLITKLSKENPEVFEVCLEYIDECQEKLETISLSIQSGAFELICSLIWNFAEFSYNFVNKILTIFDEIIERLPILELPLLIIALPLLVYFHIIVEPIFLLGLLFGCDWIDPFPM